MSALKSRPSSAVHIRPEAAHAHRVTQAQRLRAVLADGRRHTGAELVERVGHRFGASILVLRRGEDGGPPLVIRKEPLREDASQWEYWSEGPNPNPPRPAETWKAKAQRLESINRRLVAALLRVGVQVPLP